jgi:hypothetical protein
MKTLVAAAAGALAAWLYRSRRAREEGRRRLATASGSLRQATQAAASAAAGRAERAAGAVDASPLPGPVKETARRATTAVRAAGEQLGGAMPAAPAQPAALYVQELRDGSWIGNAAWGGRTLTDGATDAQVVIRRLAARLAAMPGAGRPDSVKVTRVSQGGRREEHESDLASLLG